MNVNVENITTLISSFFWEVWILSCGGMDCKQSQNEDIRHVYCHHHHHHYHWSRWNHLWCVLRRDRFANLGVRYCNDTYRACRVKIDMREVKTECHLVNGITQMYGCLRIITVEGRKTNYDQYGNPYTKPRRRKKIHCIF